MVADTDADVLPWRRRPARVRPDGFMAPRERFGHGARSFSVPFNRVRVRSSAGLVVAKATAAHQYTIAAIDYDAIDDDRRQRGLRYLPYIARAVIESLRRHPALNATIDEACVRRHDAVHLGIAVDLDHQGLVVPVVRDAHLLNVEGLAHGIADVAARARSRRLTPADVGGGTFTITNPGGFGTHWSFPIINVPQVAILSVDGVAKRVVARDDQIRIGVVGNVGLATDARAVSAIEAAEFLASVRDELAATGRSSWW